jgi:hypothetical protein
MPSPKGPARASEAFKPVEHLIQEISIAKAAENGSLKQEVAAATPLDGGVVAGAHSTRHLLLESLLNRQSLVIV